MPFNFSAGEVHITVAKLRHIFTILTTLALTLLLSGCDMMLLNPKGIVAADQKHILIISVVLMLLIVVPVLILTLVIARKYRASNTKAKYEPDWAHSTLIEFVCWAIPCAIIIALATITWISSHRLDPYRPLDVDAKTKTITIQVVALNWRWLFIYPEQKIASINLMQFPANTQVKLLITADAPMNSIQIPQLAGQIYAMPGMQSQLHLLANEPGDYYGFSANFSGEGFSNMQFTARVTSQAEFEKWVQSVKKSPNFLTMPAYNKLALPSEDGKVQYFSSVSNNLFKNIIMKYMMPDMHNMDSKSAAMSAN